jgi:2,4-dienoyl-CoA reductase-like NADH-dependent reductase (Old Yellow Enzyme family)
MPVAARLADRFDLTAEVQLRNRIVATAHGSGAIVDGLPVAGDAEYWGRVAAGGAAMVITGGTVVSADSTVRRGNFTAAWRPEVKPGLRRRADAIHDAGAIALVQLVHLGRETLGAERYYAPVAPSAVRSRREPTAPRPLGGAEIAALVSAHRVSAEHALQTGFDGIELHAAHGYLLAQFLSPVANRRPSARDAAGRAEPVWRIVEAIREVGPSTVIGIRLSVGDAHDAGLDLEQLEELLALLPPSVDYVNLTVGMRGSYVRDMATERPPLLADVAALRALTDRPLLISQAFRDPDAMQRALAAGADLVGVARALIADPDLPLKVLAGRAGEVRPCVACNEDCRTFEPTLLCTVNPDLAPPGESSRPAEPLVVGTPAPERAARVGIVGAGPAGLECALTLARAGDREVVVWERETDVGGALATAAAAPHRHGWLALLDYYRAALRAAGATLRLGEEATAADLQECDAVVVACGAEEALPVAGDAGIASSAALAAGPERLRGAAHLVVVDDGFGWWPSVSAVELGVAAGVERITLVTPGVAFAMGIPADSRTQLLPRLAGVRLEIRPLTSLAGLEDGAVELRPAGDGVRERVEADAVIVVGERRPRDWAPLVAGLPGAIVIGDAIVPRRAAHAIAEGRAAARALAQGADRRGTALAVGSSPAGVGGGSQPGQ